MPNNSLETIKSTLAKKKVFFIDNDGTLTISGEPIAGAADIVPTLQKAGYEAFVLTNNSSRTAAAHAEKMRACGINIQPEQIIVSLDAAIDYLLEYDLKNVFLVANDEVLAYAKARDLTQTETNAQALLLTYDTAITYEKLTKLCDFVRADIPYFATHTDKFYPRTAGRLPDIGSFIDLIEAVTNRAPERDFGKPNLGLIAPTLKKLNLKLEDAVIIGDRLYTDIAMAHDNELTSILVLSGESTEAMHEGSQYKADFVLENIDTLKALLQ